LIEVFDWNSSDGVGVNSTLLSDIDVDISLELTDDVELTEDDEDVSEDVGVSLELTDDDDEVEVD